MGAIVMAKCDCGFRREMLLGGGMRTFATYCGFPFFCPLCKVMFESNILAGKVVCPSCNGTDGILYSNSSLCFRKGRPVFKWKVAGYEEEDLDLTDGDYLCPGCGQPKMTFVHRGLWD
jgi:hypothetical protein